MFNSAISIFNVFTYNCNINRNTCCTTLRTDNRKAVSQCFYYLGLDTATICNRIDKNISMKKFFSASLYIFLIIPVAIGQHPSIDKKFFFTDQTILPVTIVTSMNKILGYSNPQKVSKYPARFTCRLPDSTTISQQVQLEIRGHYRRENCYVPPLRVIFTKNDSTASPFSSLKKLKLVNGCRQNS